MAWDYTLSSEIKVDILVGLDSYWKFVKPQITGCSVEGLMAQSKVFGWVLFGFVPVAQMTWPVMSYPLLFLTVSEQSVKSFWQLESIGISPDKEDSVLTRFENDLKQVEGHYEVTLPWKSGARERLLDNEKLARYRLDSLRRRLGRDPRLNWGMMMLFRKCVILALWRKSRWMRWHVKTLYFTCHIVQWSGNLQYLPKSSQFLMPRWKDKMASH